MKPGILLRVADRKRAGHEFESIEIRGTRNGYGVELGDIATVVDGYEDTDEASYFNGRPAVRVTAYRVGDETPGSVAAAVRDYAAELRAELPANVDVAIWNDDSEVLADRIDLLVRNARLGLVLVVVIWLSTALFQVPQHRRLESGFDEQAHRRLVNTNWIRIIAWTARSILTLTWLT